MEIIAESQSLTLRHDWSLGRDFSQGAQQTPVRQSQVLRIQCQENGKTTGIGECMPSKRVGESMKEALDWVRAVQSMNWVAGDWDSFQHSLPSGSENHRAATAALESAFGDWSGKQLQQPLHQLLGIPTPGSHPTFFSLGIASPNAFEAKLSEAEAFRQIKVKIGGPHDKECLDLLLARFPGIPLLLDGNESWKTAEAAIQHLSPLLEIPSLVALEQPLHSSASVREWDELARHCPVPLMADESCKSLEDLAKLPESIQAINVKLAKTGSVRSCLELQMQARKKGRRVMLGCMIESLLGIAPLLHLASHADWLDLDSPWLVQENEYEGIALDNGYLHLTHPAAAGLGIFKRNQT